MPFSHKQLSSFLSDLEQLAQKNDIPENPTQVKALEGILRVLLSESEDQDKKKKMREVLGNLREPKKYSDSGAYALIFPEISAILAPVLTTLADDILFSYAENNIIHLSETKNYVTIFSIPSNNLALLKPTSGHPFTRGSLCPASLSQKLENTFNVVLSNQPLFSSLKEELEKKDGIILSQHFLDYLKKNGLSVPLDSTHASLYFKMSFLYDLQGIESWIVYFVAYGLEKKQQDSLKLNPGTVQEILKNLRAKREALLRVIRWKDASLLSTDDIPSNAPQVNMCLESYSLAAGLMYTLNRILNVYRSLEEDFHLKILAPDLAGWNGVDNEIKKPDVQESIGKFQRTLHQRVFENFVTQLRSSLPLYLYQHRHYCHLQLDLFISIYKEFIRFLDKVSYLDLKNGQDPNSKALCEAFYAVLSILKIQHEAIYKNSDFLDTGLKLLALEEKEQTGLKLLALRRKEDSGGELSASEKEEQKKLLTLEQEQQSFEVIRSNIQTIFQGPVGQDTDINVAYQRFFGETNAFAADAEDWFAIITEEESGHTQIFSTPEKFFAAQEAKQIPVRLCITNDVYGNTSISARYTDYQKAPDILDVEPHSALTPLAVEQPTKVLKPKKLIVIARDCSGSMYITTFKNDYYNEVVLKCREEYLKELQKHLDPKSLVAITGFGQDNALEISCLLTLDEAVESLQANIREKKLFYSHTYVWPLVSALEDILNTDLVQKADITGICYTCITDGEFMDPYITGPEPEPKAFERENARFEKCAAFGLRYDPKDGSSSLTLISIILQAFGRKKGIKPSEVTMIYLGLGSSLRPSDAIRFTTILTLNDDSVTAKAALIKQWTQVATKSLTVSLKINALKGIVPLGARQGCFSGYENNEMLTVVPGGGAVTRVFSSKLIPALKRLATENMSEKNLAQEFFSHLDTFNKMMGVVPVSDLEVSSFSRLLDVYRNAFSPIINKVSMDAVKDAIANVHTEERALHAQGKLSMQTVTVPLEKKEPELGPRGEGSSNTPVLLSRAAAPTPPLPSEMLAPPAECLRGKESSPPSPAPAFPPKESSPPSPAPAFAAPPEALGFAPPPHLFAAGAGRDSNEAFRESCEKALRAHICRGDKLVKSILEDSDPLRALCLKLYYQIQNINRLIPYLHPMNVLHYIPPEMATLIKKEGYNRSQLKNLFSTIQDQRTTSFERDQIQRIFISYIDNLFKMSTAPSHTHRP